LNTAVTAAVQGLLSQAVDVYFTHPPPPILSLSLTVGRKDFKVIFLWKILINPITLAKSYIKISFFCRNFRRESIDTGLKVVGLIV